MVMIFVVILILALVGLSFSCLCKKGRESESDLAWGGLTGAKNSRMFLKIFLRIIQELKEVRGLGCHEAGDGRVVLVGAILVGKLSAVDLDFSLRCSEPKPKNCK
jgi:hypothetical protein